MTDSARKAFLTGDRPGAVAVFIADTILAGDTHRLDAFGDRLDDGVFLVVDGEHGRELIADVIGTDAMAFARDAMQTEGTIANDLTTGTCPAGDENSEHEVSILFAFVEEQHADLDGRYGDASILHAYVGCSCGETYSDRWALTD